MPFTPLHLGPGAVLKGLGGEYFSFMVFGGSQVLMDIEPLVAMIRGESVLHGYTHTIAGALVIGTIAGIAGRPTSKLALDILHVSYSRFTWRASFIAAYFGTYSHIVLDSLMHADMQPWWPLSEENGFLNAITIGQISILCLGLGALGAILIAAKSLANKSGGKKEQ